VLPETMWCLRLLLLVVLLPWSSSVKRKLGDDGKEARAEKEADYRTGYSEDKKQEIREKDADQHRTARASYSEEKKQEVREENAHQHRTARKKKQEVREENAHQHRTAYARLLAENAEAEAKRREEEEAKPLKKEAKRREEEEAKPLKKREGIKKPLQVLNDEWFDLEPADGYPLREEEEAKPLKKEAKRREEQEAKRKEKRENTKKPLQLLNDEWFDLEPADGYPLPSSAQHFSQRQPVTAGKFAFKKSDISLANPFLANDRAACSGYAGVSIQRKVPGFLTERPSSTTSGSRGS
jgi:hypothetical protein